LFLTTNREFRSVLPGSLHIVVNLHKIVCLQQDIIVHRHRDTIATRPGIKNSNKDEKLSFGLHQRIAYAPGSLIKKSPGTRQDTRMRFRKDTTKVRKMNGSRNTDYLLHAVLITGSDTSNGIQQRVPPRPAGVKRDEPVSPPFRHRTPTGTHRDTR